jgi:hypothetical protein
MSGTYFASPIQTLSKFKKDPGHDWITAHDPVEAYNVLSAIIRLDVHDIVIVDNPLTVISSAIVTNSRMHLSRLGTTLT